MYFAKKIDVFKVETIGTSCVAVCWIGKQLCMSSEQCCSFFETSDHGTCDAEFLLFHEITAWTESRSSRWHILQGNGHSRWDPILLILVYSGPIASGELRGQKSCKFR